MSQIYLQFNEEDFVKQPDGSYIYKNDAPITATTKSQPKDTKKKKQQYTSGYPISSIARHYL